MRNNASVIDQGTRLALALVLEVAEVFGTRLLKGDVRRRDVHERVVAGQDRVQPSFGLSARQIPGGRLAAPGPHAPEAAARLGAVRAA